MQKLPILASKGVANLKGRLFQHFRFRNCFPRHQSKCFRKMILTSREHKVFLSFVSVAVGDFQSSPLNYQHCAVVGRELWGPVYKVIRRLQCKDSAELSFSFCHPLVHLSRWKMPRERGTHAQKKHGTKVNYN